MSFCVPVCVCVFVCPRLYLRNYTSDLHLILCACYLWPWLCLLWRRSDMLCTSGFMDDVMFAHMPRSKVARHRRLAEAQCTGSLRFGYKLCAVIPVAGQRDYFSGAYNTFPGGNNRASLWSMTDLLSTAVLADRIAMLHANT